MNPYIKFLLIAILSMACLFPAAAESNKEWRAYELNVDKSQSELKQYCYLDLVGFGQWKDGHMVGCHPGGKNEYVYFTIYNRPSFLGIFDMEEIDFHWRNTGDGNWDDIYVLGSENKLVYSKRKPAWAERYDDIEGWMEIKEVQKNSQGVYLITLDNLGIARKFKVVVTTNKR